MAAAQKPEQETAGTPGTAVAPVEQQGGITALMRSEAAQRRIIPLLGAGADYERVVAEMWLATQANRDLLKCPPLEIIKATARAVATGGVIGRDVYLLPYGQKIEVSEDYKFLAKMIVSAGGARKITPEVVYEGDEFEYEYGTNQFLRHKPSGAPADRKITHAYVIARVRFGEDIILVMTREEVEAVRQKYSKSWKRGTLEEIPWYAKKTCVRRIAKLLPSNPRLAAALAKLGLVGDFEVDGDALPELPAGASGEAPTMEYRLNPAYPGRALADAGESPFDPGRKPTGLEVPHRVITDSDRVRPSAELLRRHAEAPDPFEEAPRASAASEQAPPPDDADFSFPGDDDDEELLPHEVSEGGEARSQSQSASASATPPSSAPTGAAAFLMPFGADKGKPIGELETKPLRSALRWAEKNNFSPEFQEAAKAVLASRGEG